MPDEKKEEQYKKVQCFSLDEIESYNTSITNTSFKKAIQTTTKQENNTKKEDDK